MYSMCVCILMYVKVFAYVVYMYVYIYKYILYIFVCVCIYVFKAVSLIYFSRWSLNSNNRMEKERLVKCLLPAR